MNGKYIVVKADGTIEVGAGEGDVSLAFMQEKVGGLIERIPLPFETTIDLWCDEEGLLKDYKENVDVSDYLNYVMQSQYYWIYCQNVRSDAIGQSNINAEKLKRFVFPLPPLQEQKRIVDVISRLMAKIEHL